jgi:hypothetical protein
MSQRRIKKRITPQPDGWVELVQADSELALTPLLNHAIERAWRPDMERPDTDRVEMVYIRHSWGVWWPYAVQLKEKPPRLDSPREDMETLMILLFGPPLLCPLCGKQLRHPEIFGSRWHRHCLAVAYARDAVRFGDDEQQKWGRSILGEAKAAGG